MLFINTFIDIHNLTLSFAGWLDDIGLPQYKDNFYDGRVDGQMLHYLTVVGPLFFSVLFPSWVCNDWFSS